MNAGRARLRGFGDICNRLKEGNMPASPSHTMSRSASAIMVGAWLAFGIPVSATANVITDWDDKATVAVMPMAALGGTTPYMAERMMAMVHAAMFDAVNSIERRYQPYLVQLPADPATSKEAAAATAAATLLATIDAKTATEIKGALAPTWRRSPMAPRKRMASGLAKPSPQRSSRRGRTMVATLRTPTGREPHRASMCRQRSPSIRCGRI
jgi:hypothetical protein